MPAFRAANLALAFPIELAGLAVLGWWGDAAGGIALAVVFPLAAAAVWGAFVAPKAAVPVPAPFRAAIAFAELAAVAAGLVDLGHPVFAGAFAAVALANRKLAKP